MAPMALYNYLLFDRPELANSDKRATVIINIGAESTDLVVCTASGVWQRCIVMGGNTFTGAIAETFKLSFEKAEKLKRTAPVSKYARQIFQAMRPVFTDWSGEVQRSLGFYTSSNPDVKVTRVIAMGGGTKLRGLVKYLSQTLQLPVEKPDAFKRLAMAPGVSAAKFHENVSDFGVVYGLGLQGLGLARIESNLLPTSIARAQAWAGKMKYFVGAAVMLLAVSALCLGRVALDQYNYTKAGNVRSQIQRVVGEASAVMAKTGGIDEEKGKLLERMKKNFEVFHYRDIVPWLHEIIFSAVPNVATNPEQKELYEAFARGDVATVKQVPRPERKQLFLTTVSLYYSDDLEKAQFHQNLNMRRDALMQEAETMDEGAGYEDEMMMMQDMYGPGYMEGMPGMTQAEKIPGFVITIEGYSPYQNIGNLLDPPNVQASPEKWGFVTRLEHLKQFLHLDVNSPLEVWPALKDAKHFKLDKGPVDLDTDVVPMGVGELLFIPDPPAPGTTPTPGGYDYGYGMGPQNGTLTLIDPMTKETISAETVLDARGNPSYDPTGKPVKKNHDSWFRLQFKLHWKEAPKSAAPAPGAPGAPAPGPAPAPRPPKSSGGDNFDG